MRNFKEGDEVVFSDSYELKPVPLTIYKYVSEDEIYLRTRMGYESTCSFTSDEIKHVDKEETVFRYFVNGEEVEELDGVLELVNKEHDKEIFIDDVLDKAIKGANHWFKNINKEL